MMPLNKKPRPPADLFYYLASPYSKYPGGLDQAYQDIARVAGRLLRDGYHVYSPIAHCHTAAHLVELPTSHEFWLDLDFKFIRRADALLVAKMGTWEQSKGVLAEIDFALQIRKPVYFLNPQTLRLEHADDAEA